MEAKEKERMLYTSPNWESLIANIILPKMFWVATPKMLFQVACTLAKTSSQHEYGVGAHCFKIKG